MQTEISEGLERFFRRLPSQNKWQKAWNELLIFGIKNALSCIFPVFIFASLYVTQELGTGPVPRYDALLLACLAMQAVMYWSGLETKDELKVICLFHLVGLVMEIYKVNHGQWSYPSFAYSKVFGVPLFSGFMYASVASFMTQAWRYFHIDLHRWPRKIFTVLTGGAIYLNFFTNAYLPDVRWILIPVLFVVFFRTSVSFSTNQRRAMPVTLAFVLICFFIWIAENIATLLQAWQYRYQQGGWNLVHLGIIVSWFLLVIISFILVAELKRVKEKSE